MGKIILCKIKASSFSKKVLTEFYINNELICKVGYKEEKVLNLDDGIYEMYCKIDSCTSPSKTEKLIVDKNTKRIEFEEGFLKPKILITNLDNDITNLETIEKITISKNNKSNDSINASKKKNEITVLRFFSVIIGIILLIYGINLVIDGNRNVSGIKDFDYTISSQGLDENNLYKIKGTVVNNTRKTIDGLQIEFKCYDANSTLVDNLKDYVEDLGPSETWSYEATSFSNSDKIANCEFYQISPFTEILNLH